MPNSHPRRRLTIQLMFIGFLVVLGVLVQRFDNSAKRDRQASTPTLTSATAEATMLPHAFQSAQRKALKIGVGKFTDPIALAAGNNGELVALDNRKTPILRRFALDGSEKSTQALPASLSGESVPNLISVDHNGTTYVARHNAPGIWKFDGKNVEKLAVSVTPMGLATAGVVLFVLGKEMEGIERVDGASSQRIHLSEVPRSGSLSQLRVRENGDFYAYAPAERLVWRFDASGQLLEKIGGSGEAPPKTNLPGDYIGRHFDVSENGDVFWTLGDYGALLKIDPRAKTAVQFQGREEDGKPWTGNFASLAGFTVANDFGYVLDRSTKRITAIPVNWVQVNAPRTAQTDTRAFGLNFRLQSDTPYKIFTSPQAKLRATFDGGNRSIQRTRLVLTVRDFEGNVVNTTSSTPALSGSAPAKLELPALNLPRLGWYQIDAALFAADDPASTPPLLERVHFVTRTVADASLPIPDREYSGWEDLQTHRMIGMGLHRFALHKFDQIDPLQTDVRAARKAGIPYVILLINPVDCTPEKLKVVVGELRTYGDEAPLLELVNEPDLKMSAREYVELLKRNRETIKRISPQARIMGPVQCGVELGWLEEFFKLGGGELIDVVSLHTYERHNTMDAYHWKWKFERVQELLKKYRSDQKPIYQTEHGFLGNYGGYFSRPQWQANQLTLEKLVLDRFGIDDEKYYYYYVNESGYREFNAYIVNSEHELYPAAAMTRIRRHLLGDKKLARALEFPAPGDWLLNGNLYRGASGDLIILQNSGALKPVELQATLPNGARVLDCWGNALPAGQTLSVGRAPLYIALPRGATFDLRLPAFGRDIASSARITTTDAKGQSSVARLTNGRLEFDFHNQPERVGFLASDGKLPLDLDFEWSTAQQISSAILYASMADNDKSTPLEYELLARQNGAWRKVDEIVQSPRGQVFNAGSTPRLTNYENPWIFQHRLGRTGQTISTDALRFRFKRTTRGHFATEEFAQSIGPQISQKFAPRVELREIQIFGR